MSLFDELNQSFDSDTTVVLDSSSLKEYPSILSQDDSQDRSPHVMHIKAFVSKSLSTAGSNDPLYSGRNTTNNDFRFAPSDYSGSEWGDPADDSDPDGRFDALDEAIENFVDCINSDFDSAYDSQDDDSPVLDSSVSGSSYTPTNMLHFLQRMQNLPSQMPLEDSLVKLIKLHGQLVSETSCHWTLLRDMMHTANKVGHDLATSTLDTRDLILLTDQLAFALPEVDARLCDEVALLESETHGLIADLVSLNDSLHEMKQTATEAQRLLRSTQNMVVVWQKEIDDVTAANTWLKSRNCEEKLTNRSTALELCKIRAGFDKVCHEMRQNVAKGLEEQRLLI